MIFLLNEITVGKLNVKLNLYLKKKQFCCKFELIENSAGPVENSRPWRISFLFTLLSPALFTAHIMYSFSSNKINNSGLQQSAMFRLHSFTLSTIG